MIRHGPLREPPQQVIGGDGATDDKNVSNLLDAVALTVGTDSPCGKNAASYRRVHGDGTGFRANIECARQRI
jgi:hypothetical protein